MFEIRKIVLTVSSQELLMERYQFMLENFASVENLFSQIYKGTISSCIFNLVYFQRRCYNNTNSITIDYFANILFLSSVQYVAELRTFIIFPR